MKTIVTLLLSAILYSGFSQTIEYSYDYSTIDVRMEPDEKGELFKEINKSITPGILKLEDFPIISDKTSDTLIIATKVTIEKLDEDFNVIDTQSHIFKYAGVDIKNKIKFYVSFEMESGRRTSEYKLEVYTKTEYKKSFAYLYYDYNSKLKEFNTSFSMYNLEKL